MKNTIQTTRFGDVDVTEEHLIEFRDGMIGFPHLKQYVLVESSSMPLLLWLQSTENPAVAFPLMEPWFFKRDYGPTPTDAERACLKLDTGDRTKIFVVITIPPDMMRMTVNLKAPVFVNLDKGRAVQVILSDKAYEVRVPCHEAFVEAVSTCVAAERASDRKPVPQQIPASTDAWQPVSVKGGRGEKALSV